MKTRTAWLSLFLIGSVAAFAKGAELGEQDHRISINPVKQSKGIKTGAVIAYGHKINAPYVIEYREKKLFLNGIQIEPSLIIERTHPRAIPDASDKALGDMIERFSKEARKAYSEGKSTGEIIRLAKEQPGVSGAQMKSPTSLMLTLQHPSGPINFLISFAGITPGKELKEIDKNKAASVQAAAMQSDILALKRALSQGRCLVFASDNTRSLLPASHEAPKRIKQVMSDRSASPEAKLLHLRQILSGNPAAAKDVLDNYSDTEWAHD